MKFVDECYTDLQAVAHNRFCRSSIKLKNKTQTSDIPWKACDLRTGNRCLFTHALVYTCRLTSPTTTTATLDSHVYITSKGLGSQLSRPCPGVPQSAGNCSLTRSRLSQRKHFWPAKNTDPNFTRSWSSQLTVGTPLPKHRKHRVWGWPSHHIRSIECS